MSNRLKKDKVLKVGLILLSFVFGISGAIAQSEVGSIELGSNVKLLTLKNDTFLLNMGLVRNVLNQNSYSSKFKVADSSSLVFHKILVINKDGELDTLTNEIEAIRFDDIAWLNQTLDENNYFDLNFYNKNAKYISSIFLKTLTHELSLRIHVSNKDQYEKLISYIIKIYFKGSSEIQNQLSTVFLNDILLGISR